MSNLLIIIIIILLNSFFVLSEIAILTSSQAKLHKMAQRGKKNGAKKALSLMKEPEVFLSTIQVGITFMSVLLGFYSGPSVGKYISKALGDMPYIGEYIKDYANVVGSIISIVIITYITVLSEIIPKRIAMLFPDRIASLISYPMYFCTILIYPIIYILTISVKFILKILRIKESINQISIEEIKFIISQAEYGGAIEKTERDMMKRLVNLNNMQVGTIMTPRNKIVSLDLNNEDNVNFNKIKQHKFNYFPIIHGDLNQLSGVVSTKRLISTGRNTINNITLLEAARDFPIFYIPEMARVTKLIELFRDKRIEIAFVIDEYGEIEGIVTLNDILKTFLGDLTSLMDNNRRCIVKKSEGKYLVNGNLPIEEVMDLLQLSSLPGDEEEDYRTLASFILAQMNGLPQVGDSFISSGWEFKVINMDNLRIDRVLIKKEDQQEQ